MDDERIGRAIRRLRQRRGWRLADLARASGLSSAALSRIELGRLGSVPLDRIRAAGSAIDLRLELQPRWRGGDLYRLLDERHAALADAVVRSITGVGWLAVPEASFSIYGERGSVDILAWHPQRSTLLICELKTEIVDIQDLLSTFDRKRRLAPELARPRGWQVRQTGAWSHRC